jgi:serine/threonine-protein kinase
MGLVFLADDPSLNRQVAIKMLDVGADSESDREFLRTRLLRDARAAAILSHPNIVNVFDIVEDGESVYVVMEYIEGENLASYLDKTPLPDHEFVLRVLQQAAAALDYTHGRGIIHRDIKPANIMINLAGGVKILDFGIARITDTRTTTPSGMVMGTVDYMAPEQVKAEMIDGRADQFSLAAVAYRMISGSTLFGRHTLATLAYKLVNESPQPVCQHNAAIPLAVDKVLSTALAKSPADRFANCSAFAEALRKAFSGEAIAAPVALPAKRSKAAALVTGIALLAGGGALAVWKLNTPKPVAPVPVDTPVKPATPKAATPSTPSHQEPAHKQPAAKPETAAVLPAPVVPKPPPKPIIEEPPPIPVEAAVDPVEALPDPLPPSSPAAKETYMHKGQDAMKARDYPEAIRNFDRAVQLHPNMFLAYANRGLAHQMSSQFPKAIQDYSDALRLGSKDPHVLVNRGVCEVKVHQDDLALADFSRALSMDKNLPAALTGRGGILMRRRQYKPAIDDFSAAIHLRPKSVVAYENRAKARKAIGDAFGAADDYATLQRLQRK